MARNKYIRFDWAAKYILRDKSNFCILEGLIAVLLGENVQIEEILESEGNQQLPDDKFNRVDIKAKNSKGEIIIVEIQQTRELYYLERILYGVAKAITEHINLGNKYDQVKKVYSINILYFDLGKGEDYIYRGQTSFTGLNTKDTLQITTREKDVIKMKAPEEVFPEYYLIRVNAFNKIAQNHMEEWMRYFKDGEIDDNTTAPGLMEAKRKLEYLNMSEAERRAYDEHINAVMIQNDVLSTNYAEGLADGEKKGRIEGENKGRIEGEKKGREEERKIQEQKHYEDKLASAKALKQSGVSHEIIAQSLGLSKEEIESL